MSNTQAAVLIVCVSVTGSAAVFGAFYAYFLRTEDPASWFAKARLR